MLEHQFAIWEDKIQQFPTPYEDLLNLSPCFQVQSARDGAAIEFEVPKRWIKVSPPKTVNMTDEQRQKAAARLAEMRAKRK